MENDQISFAIRDLTAQSLAVQTVLAHVFDRLWMSSPVAAIAIKAGFDDAARDLEDVAIQLGKSTRSKYAVEALRIVEDMRIATLGDHDKPKDNV